MHVILRQENEKWNLSAASNFHEGEGEIPINYTISLTLNYRVLVIKMYWQQKVVINIRSSADTIFIRVLLRTQLTSYPISIFSLCCLCRYRQISFITCKTTIIWLGSPSSLTILSRLSIKRKGKIVGITGILYIAWHTCTRQHHYGDVANRNLYHFQLRSKNSFICPRAASLRPVIDHYLIPQIIFSRLN